MSEPSERPAIASSSISVILFAQALSTETTDALRDWRQYLNTLGRPCEILAVQETVPEAPPFTSEEITKRTFPYDRAQGFRAALNEAIRSALHPLVAFATCDKQYHPGDLDKMLKMIDQVDLVVGCRIGGTPPPWRVLLDLLIGLFSRIVLGIPLERRKSWLGSAGWARRFIARWVFGVRVADPECPFRLARRSIFERIPIQSGGPFAAIEVLAKANHLTCLLTEEPVTWTPSALAPNCAMPWGKDARLVFRAPEFGAIPLSGVRA